MQDVKIGETEPGREGEYMGLCIIHSIECKPKMALKHKGY